MVTPAMVGAAKRYAYLKIFSYIYFKYNGGERVNELKVEIYQSRKRVKGLIRRVLSGYETF